MRKITFIMGIVIIVFAVNGCKAKKQISGTVQEVNGIYTETLPYTNQSLVEKYWKLTELYGNPVASVDGSREAHITFHIDGNRFDGSTGCNRFTGSYQVEENAHITLSQVATTRMMCIDMSVETQFLEVLEAAKNYLIKGDILTLSNSQNSPLARFVTVNSEEK